jgi:hypothetical protein
MVNSLTLEVRLVERMQTELSEPVVLNWDSVIHKVARTKDGESLGYVAAEDDGYIYVLSSRFREYRVPKSQVKEFDGSVVLLDLQFGKVGQYNNR